MHLNRFVHLYSSEDYLYSSAVRTLKVETLFSIVIWVLFLTHIPVKSSSDKITVIMENLQANLFFLHDQVDPLDLENPTKIAQRWHMKQCTKVDEILKTKQTKQNQPNKQKASLTVSPLWPASPGGPTGPGVPGPPGEPGKPAGPGSPRSPCKT